MTAFYVLAALAGSALGYYLGSMSGASDWELLYEILNGGALGFSALVFAYEQKDYGSWLGAVAGLIIALSLDWIAGSPLDLRNKLSFTVLGLFIGWLFWSIWRQVLMGGFIGGLIGFIWGLLRSHWFGHVCLQPGILNASLLAVQISMAGMAVGSFYMKSYGWRFLENRHKVE